jgi:hypothetical protein
MFRCGNLKFRCRYFSNLTRLDQRRESIYSNNEVVHLSLYTPYKSFSLPFNTLKTILILQ